MGTLIRRSPIVLLGLALALTFTGSARAAAETDPEVIAAQRGVAGAEAAVAKAERALTTARERMVGAIARERKKDALRKGGKPPLIRPPTNASVPPDGPPRGTTEGEQLEETLMNDLVSTPAIDRLRAAAHSAEERLTAAQTELETARAAVETARTARRDREWAALSAHPPPGRGEAVSAIEAFQRRYPQFEAARTALVELGAVPSPAELRALVRAATPAIAPAHSNEHAARLTAERNALIENTRKALAADPLLKDKADRVFEMGRAHELEGRFEAAADHYKSLLKEFPNAKSIPEAMFRLSTVLWASDRKKDAASYAIRLTKDYPRSSFVYEAHLIVAEYYLMQDLHLAARTSIEHALEQAQGRPAVERRRLLLCRALLTWATAGRTVGVAAELRTLAEGVPEATGAEADALRAQAAALLKRLDGLPLQ